MSTGLWYSSKVLEQRFRSACSLVVETVLTEGDSTVRSTDQAGAALQERLLDFDSLKREQTELARLAELYAKQQQELRDTEHALGMLLGNVGMHEPRRNMSDCLSLAADLLKRGSRQREEMIRASNALATTGISLITDSSHTLRVLGQPWMQIRCLGLVSASRSSLVLPGK